MIEFDDVRHSAPETSEEIVRVSELLRLRQSPKHFRYFKELGEQKPTKSQELGTLVHMALLEPERFAQTYAEPQADLFSDLIESATEIKEWIIDKGHKPRGRSRESWLEHAKEIDPSFRTMSERLEEWLAGRKALTQFESETVKQSKAAVLSHPIAGAFFRGERGATNVEQRLWGKFDGVWITGQPDLVCGDEVIVDLKRSFKAHPEAFMSGAFAYGYHVQAAAYVGLLGSAKRYNGEPAFAWVTVEAGAPYSVGFLVPDEAVLEAGRMEFRRLVRLYRECKAKNSWPGPAGDKSMPAALREWHLRETWQLSAEINAEEGAI